MDIKRIIPLICLLGVFVWGGIRLKQGFTKLMATDVHGNEESMSSLPSAISRNNFAQYIRAPVPIPENLELLGVSKECESYVKGLENLDLIFFRDPAFNVNYQKLSEPSSACSMTDEGVSNAETQYLKNCFLGNPVKEDKISEACVYALYGIRSELTTMLYRKQKMTEIESMPVLTELLYSEVLGATRAPEEPMNLGRLQVITDQMLEIKTLHAAKKINFYLEVKKAASESRGKTLKQQDEIWADIKSRFDKIRDTGVFDDAHPEYAAFIDTHGYDPSLTATYAKNLLTKNPNDAWGMFLSAYGHWLNDEQEEAFRDLKKAIELDPKSEDFRRVQSLLMVSGASADAFMPGLKLGISLQDFDK